MGAENVRVHSRLTVVPSKPTPFGKVHKLSFLDHMMQKHYVKTVFYFEASSARDRPKLLDRLKESLCKALSTYPLFAGRLQTRDDGLWEVKFNDAGVRIYEANCSVSMQEFLSNRCHSQLESELSRTEINSDYSITPVSVVQFTEFSCGNLAIGLSWLHAIGDAMCGTLFMKAWGETHNAAQILHPPFFHPPSLKPRAKPSLEAQSREYYKSAFVNKSEEKEVGAGNYHCATFCFSHDIVEQIIADVQNGSCKYGPPSPSDVLSALLWTAITRAQGKLNHDKTKISICQEFRKIHLPPLPYGYVGNAIHFAGVSCAVEQLLGQDLSYAANMINENAGMVDTEEVKSCIDVLNELEGEGKGLLADPPFFYSDGLTIALFDHFFCYDVLFDFGKPAQVTYMVEPPKGEGLVIIIPAAEGKSSRNVMVCLPKDVLENLYKNEELSQWLQGSSSMDG